MNQRQVRNKDGHLSSLNMNQEESHIQFTEIHFTHQFLEMYFLQRKMHLNDSLINTFIWSTFTRYIHVPRGTIQHGARALSKVGFQSVLFGGKRPLYQEIQWLLTLALVSCKGQEEPFQIRW